MDGININLSDLNYLVTIATTVSVAMATVVSLYFKSQISKSKHQIDDLKESRLFLNERVRSHEKSMLDSCKKIERLKKQNMKEIELLKQHYWEREKLLLNRISEMEKKLFDYQKKVE